MLWSRPLRNSALFRRGRDRMGARSQTRPLPLRNPRPFSEMADILKQPRQTLKEWIPTIDDCRYWGEAISLRVKPYLEFGNGKNVLSVDPVHKQLQSYLSDNNLYIGPSTFSSGFILVLHEACRLGDVDTVDYILKHHVHQFDINPETFGSQCSAGKRQSLMHAAVRGESMHILKMLVDCGASLETTDCCGKTPLLTAIGALETQLWSNEEATQLCSNEEDEATQLWSNEATQLYSNEATQLYSNEDEATQLYLNERNSKFYHTVLYLIKLGANVNCQDKNGSTALMYLERGISLVPVLIKAGADLRLGNNSGYTAIHNAVLHRNVKLLSKLLSCQSSVSSTDTSVPHPLFFNHHMLLNRTSCSQLNEIHQIATLFENQTGFSSQFIVDNLLLIITYKYYYFIKMSIWNPDDITLLPLFKSFHEAIAKRSQLHLPPPSSEPHDVYGGLVEIQSLEDLEHYNNLESVEVRIKLAYQCLIIRERCLGYGDRTLIAFLFVFGGWMLENSHDEGWLLMLRGSNMLLSRLEGGNVSILEWSIELLIREMGLIVLYNIQPDMFSHLANIIKCLGLCIDVHKKEHDHASSYKYELCVSPILHTLSKLQDSTNVDELGKLLIVKCPLYVEYHSGAPSNVLHTAIYYFERDIDFIRRVLHWGGDSLVNECGGPCAQPPLHLCRDKPEIMELLLQHGAHLDAVNVQGISAFPSNSLQCLCAHTIVTFGIPYDTLDLPRHIKLLISFHDPQVIRNKTKDKINSLI